MSKNLPWTIAQDDIPAYSKDCDCKDDDCPKEHGVGQCDVCLKEATAGVYGPGTSLVALCISCHRAKKWPRWEAHPGQNYPDAHYRTQFRASRTLTGVPKITQQIVAPTPQVLLSAIGQTPPCLSVPEALQVGFAVGQLSLFPSRS